MKYIYVSFSSFPARFDPLASRIWQIFPVSHLDYRGTYESLAYTRPVSGVGHLQ